MPSWRSVRGKSILFALLVGGAPIIADVQAANPPPNPPPPVTKPRPTPPSVTVNAGSDQTVNGGSTVTLSGTSSASGATWSQTAGSTVTLSSTSSASPTFRAPSATSSQQTLTFRYSVTRRWSWCRRETRQIVLGGGTIVTCVDTVNETISDSDTVNIKVRARVAPLSARAGSDKTVASGASVVLSGSATGGSGTKRYAWTQTGGSPTVTLSNANQARASFTAPTVTSRTTLTFKLTVTAGSRTSTDTVDVTVTASSAIPRDPVPPPVLGPPKVVDVTFTSRPAAGSTYKLGERIRARVAFNGIVTVSGSPALALGIGSRTRSMTHIGLDRGRVLDFEYQVQASDLDTNGVSVGANALSVPAGASITDSAGDAASLGLSGHAITNDPSRKVNGSQGSGLPVGGTLPACTASDP